MIPVLLQKKLAKRNVSANRIFCLFNILTIALAVSLIVGISFIPAGDLKISGQKILKPEATSHHWWPYSQEQIEVLRKGAYYRGHCTIYT